MRSSAGKRKTAEERLSALSKVATVALQVAGAASSARRWLVDIPAWQVLLPAYRLRVEFERESENLRGP